MYQLRNTFNIVSPDLLKFQSTIVPIDYFSSNVVIFVRHWCLKCLPLVTGVRFSSSKIYVAPQVNNVIRVSSTGKWLVSQPAQALDYDYDCSASFTRIITGKNVNEQFVCVPSFVDSWVKRDCTERSLRQFNYVTDDLGSTSAALSFPVYVPRKAAGNRARMIQWRQ